MLPSRHLVLAVLLSGALLSPLTHAAENAAGFGTDDYAAVLEAHVDAQGMVNYKALKASPQRLRAFVARLATLAPGAYAAWSDQQKVAFWINAYNAITLKVIVDHYPIQSSFARSFLYPKNSIRQIGGAWDGIKHRVMGQALTLDHIEHKILRKQFNEPRIHVALVCAAMGCPPLRSEPYAAERLDAQLADQTRKLLAHPKKFRVDYSGERVYLSSILKWFGEDFIKTYDTKDRFQEYSAKERAVLNYLRPFLKPRQRGFLARERLTVRYLSYDWSLNEQ